MKRAIVAGLATALIWVGGCGSSLVERVSNPARPGTGFLVRELPGKSDGTRGAGGGESGRKYGVFVPHSYDSGKQYPVLVFLHGLFEGSDPAEAFSKGLGPVIANNPAAFGYIVVVPRAGWGWKPAELDAAWEAIADVRAKFNVDDRRVFLTGLSSGGYGVWALAERQPKAFAGLIAICGGEKLSSVPKISSIPTRIYHNSGDPIVASRGSQQMAKAIKAAGNPDVTLTLYNTFGHDAWTRAYSDPQLWAWMDRLRRRDP